MSLEGTIVDEEDGVRIRVRDGQRFLDTWDGENWSERRLKDDAYLPEKAEAVIPVVGPPSKPFRNRLKKASVRRKDKLPTREGRRAWTEIEHCFRGHSPTWRLYHYQDFRVNRAGLCVKDGESLRLFQDGDAKSENYSYERHSDFKGEPKLVRRVFNAWRDRLMPMDSVCPTDPGFRVYDDLCNQMVAEWSATLDRPVADDEILLLVANSLRSSIRNT